MDDKTLRKVAGKFATGITIAGTYEQEHIVAITANSFLSVSLTPPLVMFSVMEHSHLLTVLKPGVAVGISILSKDQKHVSNLFAGLPESNDDYNFERINDCPILSDSVGWYATKVDRLIEVGDHSLVVCEVMDLGASQEDPILYYSGYRSLGKTI